MFTKFVEIFVEADQFRVVLGGEFLLGFGLVFSFEELLGSLTPRTEVVFIKDNKIPIHHMYPFVARFDIA